MDGRGDGWGWRDASSRCPPPTSVSFVVRWLRFRVQYGLAALSPWARLACTEYARLAGCSRPLSAPTPPTTAGHRDWRCPAAATPVVVPLKFRRCDTTQHVARRVSFEVPARYPNRSVRVCQGIRAHPAERSTEYLVPCLPSAFWQIHVALIPPASPSLLTCTSVSRYFNLRPTRPTTARSLCPQSSSRRPQHRTVPYSTVSRLRTTTQPRLLPGPDRVS